MSIKNFVRSVATVVAIAFVASNAQSAVYDPPSAVSSTNQIKTGTTPSGLTWAAVSTGTALPVRTSATSSFNGQPGAVVYFNQTNGQLQVDPRGYDLNSVIITFTTGTVNIGGSTPGPFTYATGTTTNAWDGASRWTSWPRVALDRWLSKTSRRSAKTPTPTPTSSATDSGSAPSSTASTASSVTRSVPWFQPSPYRNRAP